MLRTKLANEMGFLLDSPTDDYETTLGCFNLKGLSWNLTYEEAFLVKYVKCQN